MSWMVPSVIAAMAGTLVLSLVYFYLYSQDRQRFLAIWGVSWMLYSLRFCLVLISLLSAQSIVLDIGYYTSALVSGLFLLWGVYVFLGRKMPRAWLYSAGFLALWVLAAVLFDFEFLFMTLPIFIFLGVIYVSTGVVFLRSGEIGGAGKHLLGWTFIVWGIHKGDYPFLRSVIWFAPWGYLIGAMLELIAALGILLVYFQKTKQELIRQKESFQFLAESARRAEAQIQESERRFRELLQAIHLVAVMLDREGKITFCNDYLLNLTGWVRDEVLGQNWFDLFIPEEIRDSLKAAFHKWASESKFPMNYENPILTRDGELHLIVWDNTVLCDPEGNLIGSASIGRDITEHRRLEEQLRQSQKMEAVGQLAGGISHDFNNILTAIIGNAYFLMKRLSSDSLLRPYTEQILSSSERAADLTHSLLAFSRKQVLNIRPIDINETIAKVERLLSRIIGEDISLRLALNDRPLTVMADGIQIEQVLMNLAANARDAMPDGGSLVIKTESARLGMDFIKAYGFEEPGEYALIAISDTGAGMNEETKGKIFEPFFTTKEVGKGTGLGLAIVFGIIKQHGGYIEVYSEVGRGTEFRIYLPLVHAEEHKADMYPEALAPSGGTETVLIVEDDHGVRKMAREVLEEFGYTVIEAVDGEDALRKFIGHDNDIHLLILDVIMPKKSGKDVYDEIKMIQPEVKALFFSGYASDIIDKKGITEERLNFIQKPVAPFDLLKKIREILDA